MTLLRKRLLNLFWIFFEKFGLVFLSFISFFVFAIYLTPTQLGIGILLLSLSELLSMFCLAVVDNSLIRLKSISEQQDGTTFWLLLLLSIFLAVLLFLAYFWYFDDVITIMAGFVAVLLLPIQAMSRIHIIHLRRKKAFKTLAKRTIIGKLGGMSVAIGLAIYGMGEFAIVSQVTVMALISTLLIFSFEPRKLPLSFDLPWAREQILIGVPASIKALNASMYVKSSILAIEAVLGSAAVGYFNFAHRLVELPRAAIMTALISYAHPVFASRNNEQEDIFGFFLQSTKVALLIIMPAFVGLALVGESVITLLFGTKWAPATELLVGIAILTTINMCFLFLPSLLVAKGKNQFGMVGQLVSTVVALVVLLFTLQPLGLVAIVYAFAVRIGILVLVNLASIARINPKGCIGFIQSCAYSTVASLVMWFGVQALFADHSATSSAHLLLLKILSGVLIYGVSYICIHPSIGRQLVNFFSK